MGRKPAPVTDTTPIATLDTDAAEQGHAAITELSALRADQDAAVRKCAAHIGYALPADCTDPDIIQRDISANMRRSVEACLEVGRGLMVLKQACVHGQFQQRLDALGLEPRVAQRFMGTALKFSNAASTPLLKAAGNQTKLFEMLVLDDEQIEELSRDGQTGALALDDVATMSVKDLRAALRKERERSGAEKSRIEADFKADIQARDRLMANVRERANEAEAKLARYETQGVPVDDRLNALTTDILANGKKADEALHVVELLIESIDVIVTDILDRPAELRPDVAGAVLLIQRARDQGYRLARTVGRIQAAIDTRLQPAVEGHEMSLPYTPDDNTTAG
jgi:hypothetical protein